jgi:putative transposase
LMERLSSIFNMSLFKDKYRVEPARLPHWGYSSDGWYFVTICTKNRTEYFGDVRDYIMKLSDIRRIAAKFWNEIPKHFPFVLLDEWIVMPNHLHGIVIIDKPPVETRDLASLQWVENKFGPLKKQSLQSIIHGFKSSVTRWCNKTGQNFAWQPRFYDHIIRDQKSLNEIRQYIYDNPEKWQLDRNNPENLWM